MKNKINIISVILFISAFVLLTSCQKQKAEWKGTIEEENGVIVVNNPKEPFYGEDIFSLEEDLTIGEKEREEYVFYRARDIEADNEGNIYVLDIGDKQIKVYNKNGQFLKVISRKGQGPGELLSPIDIYIDERDLIYISDSENNRISIFNKQGDIINSKNFKEVSVGKIIGVNSQGEIILIMDKRSAESDRNYIVLDFSVNMYSPGFEFLKNLHNLSIPIMQIFVKDGSMLALSVPFQNRLCSTTDPMGYIYLGESQDYMVQVFSPKGGLIRKVLKECEKSKITKQDIENYVNEQYLEDKNERKFWLSTVTEEIRAPEWKPVFETFFFAQSKLLVQRLDYSEKENSVLDVFDSEGRYMAKVPLKISPRIWKGNNIYTLEEDEEGYQVVKRYKVTWKY
jgi:DNA-binding beta-propeller fold protein YncE